MPRPRKIHYHKAVLFVTMSIEEGLLLLCNPLLQTLLKSALARAQTLHPVKICHFLFEATHVHMIVAVDNPDDVKGFAERFKTESAHYINRLLGRPKRTVWCDGYDSPVLLTAADVIDKIVYLYTNPAKDCLEDSIANYPGLSSWSMFEKGIHQKIWAWIPRNAVRSVKNQYLTIKDCHALAGEMLAKAHEQMSFKLEPNIWMDYMGIHSTTVQAENNAKIVRCIKERENEYRKKRLAVHKGVVGKERLLREQLDPGHQPDRKGRRMWCICCDKELRRRFISFIKELVLRAREVYKSWCMGNYNQPFPPGLYPPAMPKLVEPVMFW